MMPSAEHNFNELELAFEDRIKKIEEKLKGGGFASDSDLSPLMIVGHDILAVVRRRWMEGENKDLFVFTYSYLAETLSTAEDVSTLTDDLGSEVVLEMNGDYSSISNIENALLFSLKDFRRRNMEDDNLLQRVIDVCRTRYKSFVDAGGYVNFLHASKMLEIVAATGTSEARNWLGDVNEEGISDFVNWSDLYKIVDDIEELEIDSCSRRLLSERQDGNGGDLDITQNELIALNKESDWHSEEMDEWGREVKETEEYIRRVEELVGQLQFDDDNHALPAVKFYLFNLIRKRVVDFDSENARSGLFLDKAQGMLDREKQYMNELVQLPTYGVEIEMPQASQAVLDENERLMSLLGLRSYEEAFLDHKGQLLLEVAAPYSYGAEVQLWIIEELARLGVLHLQNLVAGMGVVPEDDHISMHQNFGVPDDLVEAFQDENGRGDIRTLVDVMTYANVSRGRIIGRKTKSSFHIRADATEASKKNKAVQTMRDSRTGLTHAGAPARLEIRTGEFTDMWTYREMSESQIMVGLLFAFERDRNKIIDGVDDNLTRMSELFLEFKNAARQIMNKYNASSLYDSDKHKAVVLMDETEIVDECRRLWKETIRKYRKTTVSEV